MSSCCCVCSCLSATICCVVCAFAFAMAAVVSNTVDGTSCKHHAKCNKMLFHAFVNESNNSTLEDYVLQFLLNHQVMETWQVNNTKTSYNSIDKHETSAAAEASRFLDFTTSTTAAGGSVSNMTFLYPSVCGHLPVQESTSTLMVARAYAKAGYSKLAWAFLDSLFEGQQQAANNGFVPKYLYSTRLLHDTELYVTNTSIPNWKLFYPSNDSVGYYGDNENRGIPLETTTYYSSSHQLPRHQWRSSLRVSAFPLHASIVHDIYLTTAQSLEDIMALERNVHRIYQYHAYLHDSVMKDCFPLNSSSASSFSNIYNNNSNNYLADEASLNSGCYNIRHPWESLTSLASPMWQPALNATVRSKAYKSWTRSWPLPDHIRQEFPYFDSDPTYNASIFILECMTNATMRKNQTCLGNSMVPCDDEEEEEDSLLLLTASCPYFAVLDVGYAAALSKSDTDLYQSMQILLDRRNTDDRNPTDRAKFWKSRMAQVKKWQEQNEYIWEMLLWNQDKDIFSSRYLKFHQNSERMLGGSTTALANVTSHPIPIATSNDFLASWTDLSHRRLQSMAVHLLQKHGDYSFDCGDVGLWPFGGCDQPNQEERYSKGTQIDPLINWLVGDGLRRSGEGALGKYLDQSTMQFVCGRKEDALTTDGRNASWESLPVNISACRHPSFQAAYLANTTVRHHLRESCDTTHMATAALVYDILVPDSKHHDIPTPPIRNSWVITLIAVELGVAFSIGLSCLSLSWILTCRLQSYPSNGFLLNNVSSSGAAGTYGGRLGYLQSNTESVGEPYFSARGSYASSSDDLHDSLSASLASIENAQE